LRGDRAPSLLAALRTGVVMAAALVPLQVVIGDLHGLATLHHQPAKLAAMEGIWESQKGASAVLFALPDEKTRSNKYEIAIPKLASFYLTHDINGEVKGLDEFKGKHPPVAPVFWGFRLMVGVGLLMLAVGWLGAWQLKKQGEVKPWLARVLVAMTFAGWVATLAGWYVTEIGRQPYLVYGVLTTAQAAADIPTPMLGTTLAMYLSLYLALLVAYVSVVFHMARKAGYAPNAAVASPGAVAPMPFTLSLSKGS
jgi:cytochrome bd ubiquinol oxidase subunit I